MRELETKYWIYILQSEKVRKYYIGSTSKIEARLRFHNNGLQNSTKYKIPFRLIYTQEYLLKKEALGRERQIKN